jgi:hypothetical protein
VAVLAGDYLTLEKVDGVGRWKTADAIERMRSRGTLRKNWFKPRELISWPSRSESALNVALGLRKNR